MRQAEEKAAEEAAMRERELALRRRQVPSLLSFQSNKHFAKYNAPVICIAHLPVVQRTGYSHSPFACHTIKYSGLVGKRSYWHLQALLKQAKLLILNCEIIGAYKDRVGT